MSEISTRKQEIAEMQEKKQQQQNDRRERDGYDWRFPDEKPSQSACRTSFSQTPQPASVT
jgi:hypothetical protein